ncbi:hypothetical protein TSUD_106780 [Trifolium subterraneum]|uniref:Reverse transcriptase domain-containing protein n=1 Tax=Trifolium subterraneum TaxID=3900 RepID=A0A2Z6MGD1_TRISU|nr:hypothetical protein TSUD_106780 [Trifolium subterraneum]
MGSKEKEVLSDKLNQTLDDTPKTNDMEIGNTQEVNKKAKRHISDVVRKYSPTFLLIMETHTSFLKTKKFWQGIGYTNVHYVDARGHSGGIWLLKQHGSNIATDVFEVYKDTITIRLSLGTAKWFFTGIYASPVYTSRLELWHHINDPRKDITEPWLLMGDFNEIIRPSEQKGGNFSHTRAVPLLNVMNNCNLVDLNTTGGLYTWSRPCNDNRTVYRKLDRAFADVPWSMAFPEAYVEVLCKFHSDHNPLLLRCDLPRKDYGPQPFRFEAAWITHPTYSDIVKMAWGKQAGDVASCLLQVQQDSIIFNKESFGNIRKKKIHIERRLKGIKSALERVDSARLIYLQRDLQRDYDLILRQEELHWYQKARDDWIKLGDRNTKFFHTKTIIRRKKNKIHGLHLPDGLWCTDDDFLREEALKYFKNLFCDTNLRVLDGINDGPPSLMLNEEACSSLTNPISKEEVTQALNQMHPFKAPGPDGFREAIHSMRKSKRKKGDMVFKIDLEKAYHNVSWEFLHSCLIKNGFPPVSIKLIMFCVTSSSLSIMWNGCRLPSFTPTRGLRQGDPLSPYLFVICMEFLSHSILNNMEDGHWKPMRLSRNGPPLSHLFFADDVLLFAKATRSQTLNIASTLKRFADYSGLKVNTNKSKVFFSSTTRNGKISSIVASTGINRTLSLEKYLGIPMMHGRLKRRDFEFLEEKISKRLDSWQHNLLNKAGRMTLVKSVLNSILNYYMQIAWLPQTTCDFIDKMGRNFIWKGSSDTGIHLVGWDKITKAKKLGGLGIRKARDANTSLLGKLVWSVHQNSDALWVQVIKHKYLKEENLLNSTNNRTGSVTWNAIRKALSALKEGNGVIANLVMFVDIHDLEMRVRDVYKDGMWLFNSLYTTLSQEIKENLNFITISLNPSVNDCYTWKGNLNGIYTARDGYAWLNRHSFSATTISVASWSWLWHVSAPEKLKFFFWTMLHNSLPTRDMLAHRGIITRNLCPRCSNHAETTIHCLRDCDFVNRIWKSIGFLDQNFFQGVDVYAWLHNGLNSPTMMLFIAGIWWIWRARNAMCLDSEMVSFWSQKLRIMDYALLLKNCYFSTHEISTTKFVKWNALGGTGLILNVDGSSIGNPGISGFGGLIRNADGAWIHGFFGNLGVTNILHPELMAIYKGLLLAWELNIKELWCYSDSKMAIKLITDPTDVWHHYAAILNNIKDILDRE